MIHNVRNVRSFGCLLYWLVYMYFILDRLYVCYNCMSAILDNLDLCYIVSSLCLVYCYIIFDSLFVFLIESSTSVILICLHVLNIGSSACLKYLIVCMSVILDCLYACYIWSSACVWYIKLSVLMKCLYVYYVVFIYMFVILDSLYVG